MSNVSNLKPFNNFFNGFKELSLKGKFQQNGLALLKILSYFTVIIPLIVLMARGIALKGRNITQVSAGPVDLPNSLKVNKLWTYNRSSNFLRGVECIMRGSNLEITVNGFKIEIKAKNLLESGADVIVNAANIHLGGGGGIDGAIHKAGKAAYAKAHLALKNEYNGSFQTGASAAYIASGDLAKKGTIKHVIVVAGPDMRAQTMNDSHKNQLYSCYRNALELANHSKNEHIAFPLISTGIYAFDEDAATAISLQAVCDFIREKGNDLVLKKISFHVLPSESNKINKYFDLF